ncbi:unnamed protein product [Effrenium voratum]|nr:unnamed protein product [Effrenium voratum]
MGTDSLIALEDVNGSLDWNVEEVADEVSEKIPSKHDLLHTLLADLQDDTKTEFRLPEDPEVLRTLFGRAPEVQVPPERGHAPWPLPCEESPQGSNGSNASLLQ